MAGKGKPQTASSRSTAVTSGSSWQHRLSLVFLSRPCQAKALVLLSTAKEKSALLKTCLFMETIEGWGENRAVEMQRRKSWQDLIHCLPWEMCFQRQDSFSEPEHNMGFRCFKELDLQLKLSPLFSSWLHAKVLLPSGSVKEGGQYRFKRRLDMFFGCLSKSYEGRMSITMCEVQKYYIIIWEF